MSKKAKRVPKSEWTAAEREFDRLVRLMDSRHQLERINGRVAFSKFEGHFTKEQLDAMWERIK